VEFVCVTAAVRDAGRIPITTAAAVLQINRTVDEALEVLRQSGRITPEIEAQGREAKPRAAAHRTQKKLDDAEVVEAGGNLRKARKLRAEAEVVWS
jgi:hypothetical protein